MTRIVTKRIPAGKYEGQYRARLGDHGGINATHNGGAKKMKHVVCGLCRNRYAAFKSACDHCGGVTHG